MPKLYLWPTFDRDIDVQSFDNFFLLPNMPNGKKSKKKIIFFFNNYFSDHYKYFKPSFAELVYDLKWFNGIFVL